MYQTDATENARDQSQDLCRPKTKGEQLLEGWWPVFLQRSSCISGGSCSFTLRIRRTMGTPMPKSLRHHRSANKYQILHRPRPRRIRSYPQIPLHPALWFPRNISAVILPASEYRRIDSENLVDLEKRLGLCHPWMEHGISSVRRLWYHCRIICQGKKRSRIEDRLLNLHYAVYGRSEVVRAGGLSFCKVVYIEFGITGLKEPLSG